MNEDLRDWFGKGGKGGVGGGGWDRYNSSGDRVGKCGDAKEGDAYSACLSKEKARKLGKAGRAAFVKRKRAAQSKGGDAKKGNERSKGQKPIKVKTGVSESRDIETAYNRIDNLPKGSTFEDAKRIDSIFKKSKHTWSETIEAFEKNQKDAEIKPVNIKDIRITQPNVQSNKVKAMIDNVDKLPTLNAVQFSDELVIYDGHHRLLATWAVSEPKIKVNLVTLDDIKKENFADGKNPGRKGLSKRVGVSQKMSIAQLEKIAKTATGERRRMAQWNLNMKRGRMKEEYSKELNERIKIIVRDVINKMVRGGFGPRTPVQMRDEIKDKLASVIKPILNKYDYITENESDSLKEDQMVSQQTLNKIKSYKISYGKFNQKMKTDWIPMWKEEYGNDTARINELVARQLLYQISEDLFGGVEEIEFANKSKKPTNHFQMNMYLGDVILWTSPFIYVDNNHKAIARRSEIKVLNNDYDDIAVLKEADDPQAGKSAPYGSGYKKVNEVGEASAQPYEYKLDAETYYKVEYTFTTDSGLDYIVKFDLDDDMADVVFLTKQSLDIARSGGKNAFLQTFSKGELFKVMATITNIVKEFLEKYTDIKTLVMSPSKEDDTDNRRAKLYSAFIKKNIVSSKYSFKENGNEMIITRNSINEARAHRRKLVNELKLFLETNIPTQPDKWSYAKSQAKKKFDVYPSAYANAWAAKKYKELGGGWRKKK